MARTDRRIRIVTQENRGLPAALNRGFAEAIGHYHSWTSDDNLLRPDMLETLVTTLRDHPDCDIAYGGYTVIDASGRELRYQPPISPDELLFRNPVGAAFLYRSAVTKALGGYDESLFGAEDYDFWLRAGRQFSMIPVERDLYLYRRHAASLTDTRMRRIKGMVARLILRETALISQPEVRARALLTQVLSDTSKLRCPLVLQAAREHPATTLRHVPRLCHHVARMGWHRLRDAKQRLTAREGA